MWKRKIRENKGSTLPELLMTMLIVALIGSALTGGLVVVQRCYRRITQLSHAETLLSTTATLLTDQLEYATSIRSGGNSISFVNANTNARARLSWTGAEGIILCYESGGNEDEGVAVGEGEQSTAGRRTALVSEAGLTDALYTSFDSISFETEGDGRALITVKGLGVYRKATDDANAAGQENGDAQQTNAGESLVKTDLQIRTVNRLQMNRE